jgi:hypothetical protein
MSYKRVRVLFVFLLIAVMAVAVTGCAKKDAGVKDEDAIKAIQTTIEGNTKGNKLTSPIVILEKGAKKQTGEFPFKVEYTLTLADGNSKKEVLTYNVSSGGINDMGVALWNAVEAK